VGLIVLVVVLGFCVEDECEYDDEDDGLLEPEWEK
jgi:hypothetical protein